MGRSYDELECGCLISCDGGGGLVECDNDKDCKAAEYIQKHTRCKMCGECEVCCIDHCMAGAVKHTCLDWDLFIGGFTNLKCTWFSYCPWCGEKLREEETEDGRSSQKEKEGV